MLSAGITSLPVLNKRGGYKRRRPRGPARSHRRPVRREAPVRGPRPAGRGQYRRAAQARRRSCAAVRVYRKACAHRADGGSPRQQLCRRGGERGGRPAVPTEDGWRGGARRGRPTQPAGPAAPRNGGGKPAGAAHRATRSQQGRAGRPESRHPRAPAGSSAGKGRGSAPPGAGGVPVIALSVHCKQTDFSLGRTLSILQNDSKRKRLEHRFIAALIFKLPFRTWLGRALERGARSHRSPCRRRAPRGGSGSPCLLPEARKFAGIKATLPTPYRAAKGARFPGSQPAALGLRGADGGGAALTSGRAPGHCTPRPKTEMRRKSRPCLLPRNGPAPMHATRDFIPTTERAPSGAGLSSHLGFSEQNPNPSGEGSVGHLRARGAAARRSQSARSFGAAANKVDTCFVLCVAVVRVTVDSP
ncbi:uncharacterized protein LOC142065031 [Phalacrocorax aristotelis]|uniref:uncharacterized protein LOC142065031 n=1 Tax=Phalacrocorax aristotelis TaxID=126867 RepID=UPI003F4B1C52